MVQIQGCTFRNTLVDLEVAINILTTETYKVLGITTLELTSTLLELANKSIVIPEGTLQDVTSFVDSREYPMEFLVINPRSRLDGHPLILSRTWLATTYSYIGFHGGIMAITQVNAVKNLVLYPPAKQSLPIVNT